MAWVMSGENSMFISKDYSENLKNFDKSDAGKALLLYSIYIAVLWIQGKSYTSNLSAVMLNILQIVFSLTSLAVCIVLLIIAKQKPETIGLTGHRFTDSCISGTLLAVLLLTITAVHAVTAEHAGITLHVPAINLLALFTIGAVQEEITFRGYIQTRLNGLLKNPAMCSLCTACLFVLMHYPVHWAVSGFSLNVLTGFHVLVLFILHYLCSFVYQKTNCLWGAILLHFLYNTGQAVLIL